MMLKNSKYTIDSICVLSSVMQKFSHFLKMQLRTRTLSKKIAVKRSIWTTCGKCNELRLGHKRPCSHIVNKDYAVRRLQTDRCCVSGEVNNAKRSEKRSERATKKRLKMNVSQLDKLQHYGVLVMSNDPELKAKNPIEKNMYIEYKKLTIPKERAFLT